MVKSEYPRPGMVRDNYEILNGPWQFEIDKTNSMQDEDLLKKDKFSMEIIVPFSPESKLSGIEETDFMLSVWYKKKINIKKSPGKHILLHFDAVDYYSRLWINGKYADDHTGGSTPFCFDITNLVKNGENTVVLNAYDDTQNLLQASGKQAMTKEEEGCFYARTTGIWQTVWLEYVPEIYIKNVRITPNNDACQISVRVDFNTFCKGVKLSARAMLNKELVGQTDEISYKDSIEFTLNLSVLEVWCPNSPTLYNLELMLGEDKVVSYFGMRKIGINGNKIELNDKPIFMRLILDQAYYPNGILTSPDDETLKNDIERSMSAGFNGARMHMKIFEPRYIYWADKLGYLLWGEYPNWGLDVSNPAAALSMIPEWTDAIKRDYNSPAIIGWCPLNETEATRNKELFRIIYNLTKELDATRPVIDSSGYYHTITDIFDVHLYENNVEKFYEFLKPLYTNKGEAFANLRNGTDAIKYDGKQPYFVSEFGGIPWGINGGWGYSDVPKTIDEFYKNYKGLIDILLDCENICGFCYTQLTDIMQEQNGLYYYDRTPKFDAKILKRINSRKAAIEKEK